MNITLQKTSPTSIYYTICGDNGLINAQIFIQDNEAFLQPPKNFHNDFSTKEHIAISQAMSKLEDSLKQGIEPNEIKISAY